MLTHQYHTLQYYWFCIPGFIILVSLNVVKEHRCRLNRQDFLNNLEGRLASGYHSAYRFKWSSNANSYDMLASALYSLPRWKLDSLKLLMLCSRYCHNLLWVSYYQPNVMLHVQLRLLCLVYVEPPEPAIRRGANQYASMKGSSRSDDRKFNLNLPLKLHGT